MQPPIAGGNIAERKSIIVNEENEKLISYEAFLRKSAYKNTKIKTDKSFFSDSDMTSEYYLVIVYDRILNIPLLSARYYFNKSLIAMVLNGDNKKTGQDTVLKDLNLDNLKEEELFLADRLSGNIYNSVYRRHRARIFALLYSEILAYNKECSLLLMARKEKNDKLLKKYLQLGFNVIGSTMHKGKEHWIVLRNLKNIS